MALTRRLRRSRDTSPESPDDAGTPEPQLPPGPVGDYGTITASEPLVSPVAAAPQPQRRAERRLSVANLGPVLLLRTAHPRQALITAAGIAGAAALAGRTSRELGLVFVTALVGQAILGWHNDLVDARRDARHDAAGKPIALGTLDAGTVWFALACGVLLVVPLSLSNGITAGSAFLLAMAIGLLGNVVLRRGLLSWLPWAASYALFPAFLSYGGWGGDFTGNPPEIAITVLAALLGVGVHFLRALPGLVADNEDGLRHLPLRVALRIGATRLLVLSSVWTAAVLVALLITGNAVGLSQ
ncbi:4-hydroxybenzoate polyprenyltransferase [Nocardioides ginsengisegetis]|uniref:4-hydroxybenzoate polyprenyltransferase n=1 Tax=Nocardioides ginsengisegetis TaxID=661491 RepID=A0A7W3P7Z2_9ACTN|nr:hypothetical protein [Nocardioides ginsengisegetis]MBA8801899.1 4-hydroxybenzoate polyprenyltransferase [Nocardioides ginsengisegetis]